MIEVTRAWAPIAADRFYNLVKIGYYNEAGFYRVDGAQAEFGVHGKPEVSAVWMSMKLKDDPNKQSNDRGTVAFPRPYPNSRWAPVVIHTKDNRDLNQVGYAPFGKVVQGMNVVDGLTKNAGEAAAGSKPPDMDKLVHGGNAFLKANYPQMDFITSVSLDVRRGRGAPRPGSARRIVVRVLEQDDVRLRARLADARDVDGGLVLHRADLLARAAADAERGIDVRALHVHRLHRGLLAVRPRPRRSRTRDVDLLDPDRLGRRRAELLADDAGRLHRPGQAAAVIVERGADLDGRHADARASRFSVIFWIAPVGQTWPQSTQECSQ